MTFDTALAEQVLANFSKAPSVSRPRCMCHNLYVESCPNNADIISEREKANTIIREAFKEPEKCKKHGHISRGKAEAQLRSILKNQDFRPDRKDLSNIEIYKCRRVECKGHPWHVGHSPYVRREL